MASSDPSFRPRGEPDASVRYFVIDCVDLDRSAHFWGSMLGLQPARRLDGYLFMGSALPGCELVLQRADRVTQDKSPVHFDIQGPVGSDSERIVKRAERLGGTIVETVEAPEYSLTVMKDPDGNEFCVNRLPSGRPPAPIRSRRRTDAPGELGRR
ncbi:MAG: VOC family protein [bacterium]|nr:VOC family protein [bacterium]